MKPLLCLLFVAVYSVVAGPIDLIDGKYPRFFDYEDEEGNIHKVDLLEPVDMELLEEIQRNPANNEYHLFTRRNPNSYQRLRINNENSVRSSNFNARHPTIVISHGWLSNMKTNLNPVIRDAYLRLMETNVIVLDWRRLALAPYPTAARGVPDIGRGLGQFLNFLHRTTGVAFNTIHLIGFSLGGHVVGNAGRYLGGRVARITSLDPAGPLWSNNDQRLRPSDAIYVEAIHTNGGAAGLGIGSPVANVDFFPNGGKSQPGCYTPICDHNRAWEFFVATVPRPNHLMGRRCADMQEVNRDRCNGPTFPLGNTDINKRGSGMFRVNTGRRYPF
nr:pancreatic lipase-related protein 2-like [Maniola hyperantus]